MLAGLAFSWSILLDKIFLQTKHAQEDFHNEYKMKYLLLIHRNLIKYGQILPLSLVNLTSLHSANGK